MSISYEFRREAEADLDEIWEYIAADNNSGGHGYAFRTLTTSPAP